MSASEWRKTVLAEMHEVLKPLGYKKDGSTFRRKTDDGYLVVQLQSSDTCTSEYLKVCVNLGVFYEALNGSFPIGPKGPCEADCHWRDRLSAPEDPRADHWWVVNGEGEAVAAGLQIALWLTRHGLVPLQSFEKMDDVWAAMQSGGDSIGGFIQNAERLYSMKKGWPPDYWLYVWDEERRAARR